MVARHSTGTGFRSHRPRLAGSLVLAVCLIPALAGSRPAVSMGEGLTVAVQATGSVPGIADSKLPTYLAKEMNAANNAAWRFEPASSGAAPPPDRVEWSFKSVASAAGSVRSYGFSRAIFDRLLSIRHNVTVEATLYLHGEYQTRSLFEVTTMARDADTELAPAIISGAKQLMAFPSADAPADKPAGTPSQH